MLDLMYDLPSNDKVNKVIITKDVILGKQPPILEEGERNLKQAESKKGFVA
jgi:ATP-dependent Clp protease ATP-binding subunit ClpX